MHPFQDASVELMERPLLLSLLALQRKLSRPRSTRSRCQAKGFPRLQLQGQVAAIFIQASPLSDHLRSIQPTTITASLWLPFSQCISHAFYPADI